MRLEQAVGQKLMVAFAGTEPDEHVLGAIREWGAGGVTLFRFLNVENPAQVQRLTAALQAAAAEAGQSPLLIAADQEGGQLTAIGDTTPLPGNMALGATGSEELARRAGEVVGRELAAMGVNVNYAPVCDVNSNPRNPVIGVRSFGEDPHLVARLGAAMVEGLQSAGVAATAKHFPGHGDTASDSHYELPIVPHSRERLEQVEWVPFRAAVGAGVRVVMTTHVAFPRLNDDVPLPSTLSPALLKGVLRGEMGFEGVIISDAMNMAALGGKDELVVDSIAATRAGVDLLLLDADRAAQQAVYAGLLRAAERRLLDPAEVVRSAERVLALKRWLAGRPQPLLEVVGCAEHQALAAEVAARSITLVRDEAGLLPLRLSPDGRIAAVVVRPTDLTPADTSSSITCRLADALRRYHPAVEEFVIPYAPSSRDIAALREQAGRYDLFVVGTINAFQEPRQAAVVRALLEEGAHVIAVALRLPYDLLAYPDAPTYLCTYSIVDPSMDALAKGLWGEVPFQGRLPVSIPGMYPLGYNVKM